MNMKADYPGLLFRLGFCFLILLSVGAVQADLAPGTRWADPSSVRLDVEFPGNGYHATWELFRCECGDLLIRSELSIPGEVESGESLLVGGRVVLSRGFNETDDELLGASLDAPALMMQLVLSLLERVAAAGPSAVTSDIEISHEEPVNPIHLDSGGAAGSFWAPWTVRGTIKPLNQTQRQFDLQFQFSTGNPGEELLGSMRLWGLADYAKKGFPVEGSAKLSDWVLSWRDESDPAINAASDVQSLEALRKLLRMTK